MCRLIDILTTCCNVCDTDSLEVTLTVTGADVRIAVNDGVIKWNDRPIGREWVTDAAGDVVAAAILATAAHVAQRRKESSDTP